MFRYIIIFIKIQTKMKKVIPFLLTALLLFISCSRDDDNDNHVKTVFTEKKIQVGDYTLASYSVCNDSEYLIVFESGAGDETDVWRFKNMNDSTMGLADVANRLQDVVIYDRAGIGNSSLDNSERTIEKMSKDLEAVIDVYAGNRKIILVGHSLGGLIIRDYAIKNSIKIAGVLFIDPTHEKGIDFSQEQLDMEYSYIVDTLGLGPDHGGAKEILALPKNLEYMATLSTLPDVPVVVLTSMMLMPDFGLDEVAREKWYNGHKSLGEGVTDFTQKRTMKGHYIWLEDPQFVLDNLTLLIKKVQENKK